MDNYNAGGTNNSQAAAIEYMHVLEQCEHCMSEKFPSCADIVAAFEKLPRKTVYRLTDSHSIAPCFTGGVDVCRSFAVVCPDDFEQTKSGFYRIGPHGPGDGAKDTGRRA